MDKKVIALAKAFLYLLWFRVSQLAVGWLFLHITSMPSDFYKRHMYLINGVAQLFCLAGLFLADRYTRQQDFYAEGGLNLKQVFGFVLKGIRTYAAIVLIIAVLIPFFPDYDLKSVYFSGHETLLSFIVIVIIAPLLEEYLFRGMMQNELLKESYPPMLVNLIQAVSFGMMHTLNLQKIYASVMGLLFGWIKQKEGHLYSTIIMHMTINLIGWCIAH